MANWNAAEYRQDIARSGENALTYARTQAGRVRTKHPMGDRSIQSQYEGDAALAGTLAQSVTRQSMEALPCIFPIRALAHRAMWE